MTSARVKRLRHENAQLREQITWLSEMAETDQAAADLTPYEQVQEQAIDLVSTLTGLSWMSHQRFRDIASAILTESGGALTVLEAGSSLSEYREREW